MKTPAWTLLHPRATAEHLGLIPTFLDEHDERSATEQFAEKYIGGWNPMDSWRLSRDGMTLRYPGDPPMMPIAICKLRDEAIWLYPYAWVMVVKPNGDYEVSRMD